MTAINALKTIKSRIIYWSKFFSSKVNSLHVVVGSLLLGAVVLVVGLVQLAPGAEAAQNSTALIVVGCSLLVVGVFLAPLRALCIKRQKAAQKDGTHQRSVTSIDMLLAQHRWERRCQLFIASVKLKIIEQRVCFSLVCFLFRFRNRVTIQCFTCSIHYILIGLYTCFCLIIFDHLSRIKISLYNKYIYLFILIILITIIYAQNRYIKWYFSD